MDDENTLPKGTVDRTNKNKEIETFFTPSELLERINASLSSTYGSDDAKFELQRRMPDGGTKRADDSEIAIANLQAKLKQAVSSTSTLSPKEKILWSKEQRQKGNNLFSKEKYKDAIDVYLTCLIAMDKIMPTFDESKKDGEAEITTLQIDYDIKLPILLNLSLCTFNLGMLRRTEAFCDIALEITKKNAKVFFRRGKARMLLGNHKGARLDFEKALLLLRNTQQPELFTVGETSRDSPEAVISARKKEIDHVLKEMQKLHTLQKAARINRKKQKEGMEALLGKPAITSKRELSKKDEFEKDHEPLEEKHVSALYGNIKDARKYSTLKSSSRVNESLQPKLEERQKIPTLKHLFFALLINILSFLMILSLYGVVLLEW